MYLKLIQWSEALGHNTYFETKQNKIWKTHGLVACLTIQPLVTLCTARMYVLKVLEYLGTAC